MEARYEKAKKSKPKPAQSAKGADGLSNGNKMISRKHKIPIVATWEDELDLDKWEVK